MEVDSAAQGRPNLQYREGGVTVLQVWLDVVRTTSWYSLDDIRSAFPSADMVGKKLAIFNIRGGHYRPIVRVEFLAQRVYVKEFLTHAEYDRKRWMKWL